MVHPDMEISHDGQFELPKQMTPIYPTTAGLHQKTLQKLILMVLEASETGSINFDILPAACTQAFNLTPLQTLLRQLHFPAPDTRLEPLRQQLGLEELATHHLNILTIKPVSYTHLTLPTKA